MLAIKTHGEHPEFGGLSPKTILNIAFVESIQRQTYVFQSYNKRYNRADDT